ncbi:MAG TPA: tetratricopeptide repeat-containing protein, partial [Myxococcaceae bacterium]
LLLTADLVVADITIHNANVFYELGIRHARRRRGTFLLRGTLPPSEARRDVPFDIAGYRYLAYEPASPGATVAALVDGLRATITGERDDSPIYTLLANDQEEPSEELPPPSTFKDDVEIASTSRDAGMLALLAEEAQTFAWARAALRQVGRSLYKAAAYESARDVWRKLLEARPDDFETNKHLGNIYHRLGDIAESTQAIERILENRSSTWSDRAEALAQQGRNAKELWRREWAGSADLAPRREVALQSPGLAEALDHYRSALKEDLNDYYPGINALALQVITGELSGEAAGQIQAQVELTTLVRAAVERARERAAREKKVDRWAEASFADLTFLTSDDAAVVEKEYRRVLYRSSELDRETVRHQLELFSLLGLREKVLGAALRALGPSASAEGYERVLLFTGHRLDAPGRPEPRFPAAKEPAALAQIKARVESELQKAKGRVIGIAGAASGGDILFHEACQELGVPSLVYLALPASQYVVHSVQDAGPGWVERFNALIKTHPSRVLCPNGALPAWLQTRKSYGIWKRSNRWMLRSALASGYEKVTLVALWDGKDQGDGPGGTADLVLTAKEYGAKLEIIKTTEL